MILRVTLVSESESEGKGDLLRCYASKNLLLLCSKVRWMILLKFLAQDLGKSKWDIGIILLIPFRIGNVLVNISRYIHII